jgi:hypothetical protein
MRVCGGGCGLLGGPNTAEETLKAAQNLPVRWRGTELGADLPDRVRRAAAAFEAGPVEIRAAAPPATIKELLVAMRREHLSHHAFTRPRQ